MAVLDRISTSGVTAIQMVAIRSLIAREFWAWYTEHKEDTLAKVGFLFVSFTVKIKSAKFIFEALLGPQPVES